MGASLRRTGPATASPADHLTPAPRLSSLAHGFQVGAIALDVWPAWPSSNPSIVRDGAGFRMIVGTTGRERDDNGEVTVARLNYLVSLDAGLAVTEIQPIVDRSSRPEPVPARVQGYGDCRLVAAAGTWYAAASACDLSPGERPERVLLRLEGARIVEVIRLDPGSTGDDGRVWMPVAVGPALHFLASCAPTTVLRYDPASRRVEQVVADAGAPDGARSFRGGSQGARIDDGYLFVADEADAEGEVLGHRFVLLGDDLTLTAVSRPFTFMADRGGTCSGLAQHDDHLVLGFGIDDAEAALGVLALDEAVALLEDVTGLAPRTSARSRAESRPNTLTTSADSAALDGTGFFRGRVTILDGAGSVSWPAGAFGRASVSLTSQPLAVEVGGFGVGGSVLTVRIVGADGTAIATCSSPIALHLPAPEGHAVPA